MMMLTEANDLVTPILKSEIFKTSEVLQEKIKEIKELFVGFKLTNKFQLNQFETLDEEKKRLSESSLSFITNYQRNNINGQFDYINQIAHFLYLH